MHTTCDVDDVDVAPLPSALAVHGSCIGHIKMLLTTRALRLRANVKTVTCVTKFPQSKCILSTRRWQLHSMCTLHALGHTVWIKKKFMYGQLKKRGGPDGSDAEEGWCRWWWKTEGGGRRLLHLLGDSPSTLVDVKFLKQLCSYPKSYFTHNTSSMSGCPGLSHRSVVLVPPAVEHVYCQKYAQAT